MARKAAGSNLSLHNLKIAYNRNGEDGIKSILSDVNNRKFTFGS